MIVFEKIRWKNFLSTGNTFTEIPLNQDTTTIFIGESGSGKSTLLDAITFVLFNKPFRAIKKGQIVNSINKKDCLVEIHFSIGKRKYKVLRGIKPNVFEIYRNGILLNQDAKSLDYQEYLETQILKTNPKTFTQIVTLGAANFTPFMKLSAGDRRAIIEELLDIQIFSTMNQLLKEQHKELKQTLTENEYSIKLLDEKIAMQHEYLSNLKADSEERIEKNNVEIENLISEIESLEESVQELEREREPLLQQKKELDSVRSEAEKVQRDFVRLKVERDETVKKLSALDQEWFPKIGELEKKDEDARKKASEIEEKLREIKAIAVKLNKKISDSGKKNLETLIREMEQQCRDASRDISAIKKELKFFQTTNDCPTCLQTIDAAFKKKSIDDRMNTLTELEEIIKTSTDAILESNKKLDDISILESKFDLAKEKLSEGKRKLEQAKSISERVAEERERIQRELEKRETYSGQLNEHETRLKDLERILSKRKIELSRYDEIAESISALDSKIANIAGQVDSSRKQISRLERENKDLAGSSQKMNDVEKEIRTLSEEKDGEEGRRAELLDQKYVHEIGLELLKDSGIKSSVIKQYLPIINKYINYYLNEMDFFVNFQIDEEFNETILSRGRDNFSYANFSEGERQRIDLALLFTWRVVAKMKNSVNTNLLIMDEIFDSYLDETATENVIKMLYSSAFKGSNIFVISHKTAIAEQFQKKLMFEKEGNFSVVRGNSGI